MTTETLLEFPCEFPLKVIGHDSEQFFLIVEEIVVRHAGATASTTRPSRDGRYLAISFTVNATSKQQLDALYSELTSHAQVLFVL